MKLDLNFYPEDHPEEIAAIPYLVAGLDLTGISFDRLVECVVIADTALWTVQWEVGEDGEIYSRITGRKA